MTGTARRTLEELQQVLAQQKTADGREELVEDGTIQLLASEHLHAALSAW